MSRATTIRIIQASWLWLASIVYAPDRAQDVTDLAERGARPNRLEDGLNQRFGGCAGGCLDRSEGSFHGSRFPVPAQYRQTLFLRLRQLRVVRRPTRRRGISRDVFVHAHDDALPRLDITLLFVGTAADRLLEVPSCNGCDGAATAFDFIDQGPRFFLDLIR